MRLSNCRSVRPCGEHNEKVAYRVSGVDLMGTAVGSSSDNVRPAKRHENALFFLGAASEGFTLEPFWLGYVLILAVCVIWAWRLSREAEQRDAETTDRERGA